MSKAAGSGIILNFTPQIVPLKRGIFATIYARAKGAINREDLLAAYNSMYADEPFIHIYEAGLPELKHVIYSNNFACGFVYDQRTGMVIITACLDNLVKGAAGQAVQNMNILFGLPETTGLFNIAINL